MPAPMTTRKHKARKRAPKRAANPPAPPGTALRQWREDKGLTVTDAAARAGVARKQWYRLELGEAAMFETVFRVQALTGLSWESFRRSEDKAA